MPHLTDGPHFNHYAALAGALMVTLLGFVIVATHAAGLGVALEAESGALAGGGAVLSDSAASGGRAVKFTASVVNGVSIETYGAVGDGLTDNAAALNRAFSTAPAGSTLIVPAGKIYKYNNLLTITVAGLHLAGSGTLQPTNFANSALRIAANNVTVDGGMTFKFNTAGIARQTGPWNFMIWLDGVSGTKLQNITVDGSPGAGIFMYGASFYTLDGVTVQNTLADGIHSTHGSHDGVINNPTVRNVADDGVAVVSYVNDGVQCYNITVQSPRLYGGPWGRAFIVSGGHDITFRDVYSDSSDAAAILVTSEHGWNTYGDNNIKFLGGTLVNSNANTTVDYGAVLVYNEQPAQQVTNVDIENITIQNTRSTASRQVGILNMGGGGTSNIQMRNFTITGGPTNVFRQVGAGSYNTLNWIFNGTGMADHQGFTPFP